MRKIRLFLIAVCVLFCFTITAHVVQSTPVLAASVASTSSKIDATKLTIKLSATKYTYNGKEKKPKVTVKYKGKTVSGDNYTVKYSSGRKLPGTYNVTVAFKGKYTGKKTLTYKIALQAPVVEVKRYTKSVELVWDDTLKSTGYLVYNSNKKLIEKTPNPFCVIDGLNPGRKYIFYVRAYAKINGTNYYSSLIKVETATKPIISGAKTLYVGNSKVFKATATGKITWSSSDKTIATVSSSGKVTALKAGTVTIRAKANGITASYAVTVKKLTISGTKTLYVGGSKTFKTNGTGSIAWSSSDKTIATVSSTGKVKALKAGTVKITAKSNGTKVTYTLTVKTPSIKLNKTSSTIEQNKSVTLKATVAPSSMSVKWTSNNSSVAKVSSTGKVTAVAPGTATITATGTYAGKTYKKTCKVTIKSIEKSGFDVLKSYLQDYGSENVNGDMFVSTNEMVGNSEYTFGVFYDSYKDSFGFWAISECLAEDGISVSLEFILDRSSVVEEVKGIVVHYIDGDVAGSGGATAYLDLNTYTSNTQLDFDWLLGTAGYIRDCDGDFFNSFLQLSFMMWEQLVYDACGIYLADLGFVAY